MVKLEIRNLKLYYSNLLGVMSVVNRFERACNWVILKVYNFSLHEHTEESKRHIDVIMLTNPLLQKEKEELKETRKRYKENKDDAEHQFRFLSQDVMRLKTSQNARHQLMDEHLGGPKLIKRK